MIKSSESVLVLRFCSKTLVFDYSRMNGDGIDLLTLCKKPTVVQEEAGSASDIVPSHLFLITNTVSLQ